MKFSEEDASFLFDCVMVNANAALSDGRYAADPNATALIESLNLMEVCFVDFSDTDFEIDAAFYWDGHESKLYMNFTALCKVTSALGDIAAQIELSQKEINSIAITLFVLHEANHIIQGIPDYKSVQTIKRSGGEDIICELDVVSDSVAARILAGINLLGSVESERDYLLQVHGALTLSFIILTRAFPFKPSKYVKVTRGLSLLIMRERITAALLRGSFNLTHAMAVKANVSEKTGKLFVHTIECPTRAIVSLTDISAADVKNISSKISLGEIEDAENILMGHYRDQNSKVA